MLLLVVALGGAVGAVARYGVGGWIQGHAGFTFPWGTFAVNLVGSLLIGFALRFLEGVAVTPEVRALVTVGFLGAFTTFSTYSYETLALLRDGDWGHAAFYSLGSVLLGVVAVALGVAGGELLLRLRG